MEKVSFVICASSDTRPFSGLQGHECSYRNVDLALHHFHGLMVATQTVAHTGHVERCISSPFMNFIDSEIGIIYYYRRSEFDSIHLLY